MVEAKYAIIRHEVFDCEWSADLQKQASMFEIMKKAEEEGRILTSTVVKTSLDADEALLDVDEGL